MSDNLRKGQKRREGDVRVREIQADSIESKTREFGRKSGR